VQKKKNIKNAKKLSKISSNLVIKHSEKGRRRSRRRRRRRQRRFVAPRPGTTLSHLVKILVSLKLQWVVVKNVGFSMAWTVSWIKKEVQFSFDLIG
jgi:dynactin complex subunit